MDLPAQAAREADARATAIDAAAFDLKAVNPNVRTTQDTRTQRAASSGFRFSGAALGQSARWTDTPYPRVMKPTMGSPGTGVQHLPKCRETPGVSPPPRT